MHSLVTNNKSNLKRNFKKRILIFSIKAKILLVLISSKFRKKKWANIVIMSPHTKNNSSDEKAENHSKIKVRIFN